MGALTKTTLARIQKMQEQIERLNAERAVSEMNKGILFQKLADSACRSEADRKSLEQLRDRFEAMRTQALRLNDNYSLVTKVAKTAVILLPDHAEVSFGKPCIGGESEN